MRGNSLFPKMLKGLMNITELLAHHVQSVILALFSWNLELFTSFLKVVPLLKLKST